MMQLAFEVCCHEQELNERGQKLQRQWQRQRQMLGRRQVDCVVFSVWVWQHTNTIHHSGKLSQDLNYCCYCCCFCCSCCHLTVVASQLLLILQLFLLPLLLSIDLLTCALFFEFVPARFVKLLSIFVVIFIVVIVVFVAVVFVVGVEPTS